MPVVWQVQHPSLQVWCPDVAGSCHGSLGRSGNCICRAADAGPVLCPQATARGCRSRQVFELTMPPCPWPCHQQVHCSLHAACTGGCNEHFSNMGGIACHCHQGLFTRTHSSLVPACMSALNGHVQATSLWPPAFCLQEPSPGCGKRARPVGIPARQSPRQCCAQMLALNAYCMGPLCVARAVASQCCAGST